jgi:tryptophan-rich sensory protein
MTTISTPRIDRTSHPRPWLALAGFLLVCQLAGVIGVPFNERAVDSWYAWLDKPSFNPPGWVFGPVWTFLYVLMAIAAWLVWRTDDPRRRTALTLFAVQLVANAAWSPLFFGARLPGWALAELVVLWFAVAATAWWFRKIEPRAAALLVPYLAWVTFAGALNAAIVRLN